MAGPESIFHCLTKVVTVRHIQRRFAFEWNVDENSLFELDLLRHYVDAHGALSRAPVLLTGGWSSETAACPESDFPWGVYFPEKAIQMCLEKGELDPELLDNEHETLDQGACDRTTEISPRAVLSADTTLIELLQTPPDDFERCGAIVLDRTRRTGVVTVDDLMSPPAKMCFMALVQELESTATELCRLFPADCFGSLPETRQEMARKVFAQRLRPTKDILNSLLPDLQRMLVYLGGKDETAAATAFFIDCTNLTDKSRMVCKCKLAIELSNSEVKSAFGRAETLRNLCAHPGLTSERLPFSFAELRTLVSDITRMTQIFADSFAAECRVRKILPAQ